MERLDAYLLSASTDGLIDWCKDHPEARVDMPAIAYGDPMIDQHLITRCLASLPDSVRVWYPMNAIPKTVPLPEDHDLYAIVESTQSFLAYGEEFHGEKFLPSMDKLYSSVAEEQAGRVVQWLAIEEMVATGDKQHSYVVSQNRFNQILEEYPLERAIP
jgi:hypothetical protein